MSTEKIQYNTLAALFWVCAVFYAAKASSTLLQTPAGHSEGPETKPIIVTTIKPLAIIARAAAGHHADVSYLMPATQSPHDYSLPVSGLKKLAEADLVVWIGKEFETRSAKSIVQVPAKNLITALRLPMQFPTAGTQEHRHHDGLGIDPHIWLNPHNANILAAYIQVTLGLPERTIITDRQIERLKAELAPHHDKSYLSHHDAYSHFANAFDLRAGLSLRDSTGAAKGAKSQYQLRTIAASDNGAHCVFTERQYQSKDAQTLAAALQLPLVELDPQGLNQALNSNGYAEFITGLIAQFKVCFK